MTKEEFLYQFDVLFNNITSNQAPGLNGYEKSVFLTKAGIEVVKNYVNSKANRLGEGFDDSPKRHIDFSSLIKESSDYTTFPSDILIILEETCKEGDETRVVIPLSYVEYIRKLSRPYHLPLKRQVWRVIRQNGNILIGHTNITPTDYLLRYVKIPNPIIVGNLEDYIVDTDGSNITYATVGGYKPDDDIPIDIPQELHQEVLQRAVELAKIAWQGDINSTLTAGARSE